MGEECRQALLDDRIDFVLTKQAVYVAHFEYQEKPHG